MSIPVKQCPWCGSTAFVVGYQHQEARIMTSPNGLLSGCRVRHLICKSCGAVLLSKIAQPEKFPDARTAWEGGVRR